MPRNVTQNNAQRRTTPQGWARTNFIESIEQSIEQLFNKCSAKIYFSRHVQIFPCAKFALHRIALRSWDMLRHIAACCDESNTAECRTAPSGSGTDVNRALRFADST